MSKWGFVGQLCAAMNVNSCLERPGAWSAWDWFIVISGVFVVVGGFFYYQSSSLKGGLEK